MIIRTTTIKPGQPDELASDLAARVEELEAALSEIHGIARMLQTPHRERLDRIKARVEDALEGKA